MGVRILLVVAALLQYVTLASAGDTQDINVILPLTGGGAFLGKGEQQALLQYEKAVNSTGGIHGKPLKFVFHNWPTRSRPAIRPSFWDRRSSRCAMPWLP
jgi:hypothetical protein